VTERLDEGVSEGVCNNKLDPTRGRKIFVAGLRCELRPRTLSRKK
jgi:hypothetical protein